MFAGNTWLQTAVCAILSSDLDQFEQEGPPGPRMAIENIHVWDQNKDISHPAVYMSHLRYHMLPLGVRNKCNKVIHITRNPKDTATSLFHYLKIASVIDTESADKMTFGDFLENIFLNLSVPFFGDWFEYSKNWIQHMGDPNILFISYEDFLRKTTHVLSNIASFLEREVSSDKLEKISHVISFDSMRNNPKLDILQEGIVDQTKGRFIRKGKVGDWKNQFTDDQNKTFDALYSRFKLETGFQHTFM